MQHVLVGCLLLLSLILEGTLISIPLLVAAVVATSVIYRNAWYIAGVFLIGIIYDMMTMQNTGQTSVFLLVVIALSELYQRKFETRTFLFVTIATIVSVSIYILIFGSYAFFIQLLVATGFSALIYYIFLKLGILRKEK